MKQALPLSILLVLSLIPCLAQENIPCPNINVALGEKITEPGSVMIFSISPREELRNFTLEYKWTISTQYRMQEPVIESGQRTSVIHVSTAGLEDTIITATVEIKGLPQNCPNTFTGTGIVGKRPLPTFFTHSDWLDSDDMKVRVNAFYTALKYQPTSRAIIIIYGTKKHIAKQEAEIRKTVRLGKYDIKRIEFIRTIRKKKIRSQFFIIPQGVKSPVLEP